MKSIIEQYLDYLEIDLLNPRHDWLETDPEKDFELTTFYGDVNQMGQAFVKGKTRFADFIKTLTTSEREASHMLFFSLEILTVIYNRHNQQKLPCLLSDDDISNGVVQCAIILLANPMFTADTIRTRIVNMLIYTFVTVTVPTPNYITETSMLKMGELISKCN